MIKFRSQYDEQPHSKEYNSGIRHKDFNDDVRTTVSEFIEAFMAGSPVSKFVRSIEFDDDPSLDDNDFDSVAVDVFAKDIADVKNELELFDQTQLTTTTTNDDDE